MKKFIAMIMAMAMMLTLFAGCNSSETEETTIETTTETTEATTETTEATEETTEETTEEAPAVDADSLEGIINSIYGVNPVEFAPMTMPLNLEDTSEDGLWMVKTYTGLESAEKITEAVVSEAMIGAIPFSMVLVRTAEGVDPAEVADTMKANIDQRKWVCVCADDLQVVVKGDVVMLVMIGTDYGTAQSFVDAFTSVMGEPDYTA